MLLRIRGLQAFIGEFHILQGVDLEVHEGEIVVLLGRNGSGKTTTLRSIMGLVRSSDIEYGGKNIAGLPIHLPRNLSAQLQRLLVRSVHI